MIEIRIFSVFVTAPINQLEFPVWSWRWNIFLVLEKIMCVLFFARKIFYRTKIAHAIWRDDIYPLYAYSLLISFIQRKNNFIVSILLVLRKMIGNIMRNYVSQKILYPLEKLINFSVTCKLFYDCSRKYSFIYINFMLILIFRFSLKSHS